MSTYYAVSKTTKEHFLAKNLSNEDLNDADLMLVAADNEGWIKWGCGECPLPDDQMVEVRFRNGERDKETASLWDWEDYLIIAYRPVLEPEIDWSKAPEGATHYYKSMWSWYQEFNDVLYVFSPKYGWEESIYTIGDLPLIPRPTESDNSWHERGELPPVGTVCEYSLDELAWHECHIRYVLDNDPAPDSDGWKAVAWCPHLEKEQIATHYWKFRPLKTDRERTIEAAQEILSTGFLKADLEALYDSGLLRMPEDE